MNKQQNLLELVRFKRRKTAETRKLGAFLLPAAILVPVWQLLVRYRFARGSKLPESGPFILAPNHLSEIDPLNIAVAVFKLGRLPRFMAKASLFKVPVLGAILRSTGQIPVHRDKQADGGNGAALGAATQLIAKNAGVIVYPEGTLTRDPDLWPMRGKLGAARLALEGKIPLYPAAQWGIQDLMPRYGKRLNLWGRKKVGIVVGDPLDLTAYADKPITQEVLIEVTEKLMSEITRLLAGLRQEEAPSKRWDPRDHNQSETGRF